MALLLNLLRAPLSFEESYPDEFLFCAYALLCHYCAMGSYSGTVGPEG